MLNCEVCSQDKKRFLYIVYILNSHTIKIVRWSRHSISGIFHVGSSSQNTSLRLCHNDRGKHCYSRCYKNLICEYDYENCYTIQSFWLVEYGYSNPPVWAILSYYRAFRDIHSVTRDVGKLCDLDPTPLPMYSAILPRGLKAWAVARCRYYAT